PILLGTLQLHHDGNNIHDIYCTTDSWT
ncbi:unnamed protein product, partial [Leptidea sinapis]